MKPMSERQAKVATLIRQTVAEALLRGDVKNPYINPLITITDSWVSPDLRHAKVFFTLPVQGGDDVELVTASLNDEARHLMHILNKNMHTKYTPKLRFMYDASIDRQDRMDQLLSRAAARREEEAA